MSGLVAIVAHDRRGPGIEEGDLAGLLEAYSTLRGADAVEHVAEDGFVRAALIDPRSPSVIERGGGSWAVVAGTAYAARGVVDAPLGDLDGQFALVRYAAESGDVVVATDPFAMQALYVAERGGRTYVSTSSLALARHLRATPSRADFAAFVRAGYHFGTQTLWEGIERLEPGTALVFGTAGRERRIYWRPERDPEIAGLAFERVVDRSIEVAEETYHRRLAGREGGWADLTGGYDTRLLALLLDRAGVEFETNTRGDARGSDRKIAHRLSEVAGWPLLDVTVPADWAEQLPRMMKTAAAWADGTLEVLELSWVLAAHERMAQAQQHGSLLIGGGGEHLRGFAWRQEFLRAGKSTQVNWDNWLDMRMLHPMDVRLFRTDPTAAVRDDMSRRLADWVEPYRAELNTTQLDVLYAYKVTGHFGTYRSADSAFLHAELPFYFRPVFTVAFSADHRHRDNHRLMRHMIARLDRRVAAIATSTGGPAEPWRLTNLHRFAPYYAQIGRKAINKLSQRALNRALLPVRNDAWWSPPEARRAAVTALGDGDLRSRPLYDDGALAALLAGADDPGYAETTVLGRVLTAELALRAADASL
jgi:asparagine synthetase B (glutamine-hydrolysing)